MFFYWSHDVLKPVLCSQELTVLPVHEYNSASHLNPTTGHQEWINDPYCMAFWDCRPIDTVMQGHHFDRTDAWCMARWILSPDQIPYVWIWSIRQVNPRPRGLWRIVDSISHVALQWCFWPWDPSKHTNWCPKIQSHRQSKRTGILIGFL